MEVNIQRRAEIALRSLEQRQQKQVLQAIEELRSIPQEDAYWLLRLTKNKSKMPKPPKGIPKPPSSAKLSKLKQSNNLSGKELYKYHVNHELRLILSFASNMCIIEDIMARDKLKKLVANLEAQK